MTGTLDVIGWTLVGAAAGVALRPLTCRLIAVAGRNDKPLVPPVTLEAITAMLFAVLAWRIGFRPELLAVSWLAAVGVPLATIDLAVQRLPNQIIWPSYGAMPLLFAVAAIIDHNPYSFLRSLAGMGVLLAAYAALYVLLPGQLGGGDTKLAGLLGITLAWFGWSAVFMGTILGWLLAASVYLIVRVLGKRTRAASSPLGPFLLCGTFIAVAVVAAA